MNQRRYDEAVDVYDYDHLDREWTPYRNQHVISRLFKLKEEYDTFGESLGVLKEVIVDFDPHGAEYTELRHKTESAVLKLSRACEVLIFHFPDLIHEQWFRSFFEAVGSAKWRFEASEFEESPNKLEFRLNDILNHRSTSVNTGVEAQLRDYITSFGHQLNIHDTAEEYGYDVYEARDLYCLGYYSTALFVLGRAVEKALLKLGTERKIKFINPHGNRTDWREAKFYHRNEALRKIDRPDSSEKMLSPLQYQEISVLIKYRNVTAHSEYEEISKEKALPQIKKAYSLLTELNEKINELRAIDDDEIDPIQGQKTE